MLNGYKTYLTAAATLVVAWLSVYLGKLDTATALQMTSAALLAAFVRHGITTSTAALAPLLLVTLAACSSTGLSPTTQKVATVACAVDVIVQPIGLPFVSGIPTVGGVAASVDAALVHPLVIKACTDLAASLGSGAAKPVALP